MSHGKLYRSFIILQEDERGHSIAGDKPLSGYAKIEAKNDKCKITFYAQNMKKDGNKCSMVLVCSKKGMKQLIDLGAVNINDQGKAETSSEFFASDIGGVGIPFDKVSGAALSKDVGGKKIIVMYGFMNGETPIDDWKAYPVVFSKTAVENKVFEENKEKMEEYKEHEHEHHEHENEHEHEYDHEHDCEHEHHESDGGYDGYMKQDHDYHEEKGKKESEVEVKAKVEIKAEKEFEIEKEREELSKFDEYERGIEAAKAAVNSYQDTIESNYQDTVGYSNEDAFEVRGSVGEFFTGVLDDYEEARKNKEIKYCKWYNVPVKNFDSMCNISNYNKYTIVYYPMINYFPYIKKHGHYMVGLKCDESGKVKYLIYAVPGTKDKSDQPYGGKSGFVTWMPDETKGKDMGYWLMFYDFKNSMIVVPMK